MLVAAAFLVKILASLFLYWLYSRYYTNRSTADLFKYYDDSQVMLRALWSHPLDYLQMLTGIGNDTPHFQVYYQQMNNWCGIYPSNIYGDGHVLIRFHALVGLVSFGSYHVHALVMCLLSFTGIMALYRVIVSILPRYRWEGFLLLFFFPSIVLWSSSVLKEGLIFFSMGLILYSVFKLSRGPVDWKHIVLLIVSLLILRYCKFYLFLFTLPLLTAYLLVERFERKRKGLWFAGTVLLFMILALVVGEIYHDYRLPGILSRKQNDFLFLAREMQAGSRLDVAPLGSGWKDLLLQLVPGFTRTLIRPLPWEGGPLLVVASGIENAVVWMLIAWVMLFFRKPDSHALFWYVAFLFIAIFVLTGMITPVMGAMVRYKSPGLPYLFVSLMFMYDKDKASDFLKPLCQILHRSS